MSNSELKEKLIQILDKLNTSDYVDTAEDLYDGIKSIRMNLDSDNLTYYLHDFLWALDNKSVMDFDGIVKECSDEIKSWNLHT